MGQIQHTNQGGRSARGRRLGWRTCLRKGCERRFQARRQNQRYCQDPECRKEVRRWQAAKRQQKRRAGVEGRRRHAEAERQRRQRKAGEAKAAENGEATATAAAQPARGHAARRHPEVFCDRPGCYEPVRESPCAGCVLRRRMPHGHESRPRPRTQVVAAQSPGGPHQTRTGISGCTRQTSWGRQFF